MAQSATEQTKRSATSGTRPAGFRESGWSSSALGAAEGTVLDTPCDIVIPAAIEGTLDEDIAERVTARLVVEGANGPTTPEAEYVLVESGTPVVPNLVANAGGVIPSYFEWVQNHQRLPWPEAEERRRVLQRLDETWGLLAGTDPGLWRTTALIAAIRRVIDAMKVAGTIAQGGAT